uniref:Glycosyltransferase 2-like domain-containing protein n=1 Tax=Sus scrofa TaxID=9823 RepID=A0A8D0U8J4_PIG
MPWVWLHPPPPKKRASQGQVSRQLLMVLFPCREGLPRPPPLLAQPNLPFGYPVHGVEVMPLHTIPIPGLRFEGPDAPIYEVTLTASLGTLNTLADVPDNVVKGRGQKQLNILTSSRELLNFILQHVTYTSTEYHLHRVDVVSLESKSSVAKFPVTIRYPVMPKLYDPGPERKLRDLVTIATKTFLRPHKLMTMLRSVREYYPDLTVIVADDSKEPLKITDSHVEYYTMPFGKGWFAGRNLAISQVTTKYVLWVDDDFIFNSKTRIEALVDVLEKTELDVVSELSAASSTPLPSAEPEGEGEERAERKGQEERGEEKGWGGEEEGGGRGRAVQELMQSSSGVETLARK